MLYIRNEQYEKQYGKWDKSNVLPYDNGENSHYRCYGEQYGYDKVYKSFVLKEFYFFGMIIKKLLEIEIFFFKAA